MAKPANMKNYVTKKEFEAFVKRIAKQIAKLEGNPIKNKPAKKSKV